MARRHTEEDKLQLARKIRAYRQKHNLSQEELARIIHTSVFSISRWERGKHYPPASTIKLMNILGIL